MNAILLWALVVVSSGYYNQGNVTVPAYFNTLEQCESFRNSIPKALDRDAVKSRCIQSTFVFPK